jgi:electron transport complex protein RnfC
MSADELIRAIQDTGLTGLGGASFPTHVKFATPADDANPPVDVLVVNGAECEPYLTADHRVMLEQPENILRGIRLAMAACGAKRAVIGIENNKTDAAELLLSHLREDDKISVETVRVKYPQGAEKMLIMALLGRKVSPGALPRSAGVAVSNVGTLAQLGYLLPRGQGLIERVVTVTGAQVARPGNYIVPLGTPAGFILEEAGVDANHAEIIFGGPMMGMDVAELDIPVSMGVSGVLIRPKPSAGQEPLRIWPCIKCGRCLDACPMFLNPSMLGQLAAGRRYEIMQERYNLSACFECGCCAYVCPSNIPLVQHFRIAKAVNRERAV